MLSSVNVALGITGSIGAVKTVELAHELRRRGAAVRAVMTPDARGIVHPWAVEFATDGGVVTEITGSVEHVSLCGREGWADVLLIAPATANTVGKIAATVDDTPVTTCATTALGAGTPVVIAPAMHEPMYDHPGVLDAISRLEGWDVSFVSPRIEEGKAKIATEDAIAIEAARTATPSPLAGERIVVTSGATAEPLDPIRVLTNRSSGRTGRAVARACYVRGAHVTLVHGLVGPGPLARGSGESDVSYADLHQVETAAEMREATLDAMAGADALVSAAAVGDYTVEGSDEKIRSGREFSLDLEPTPKLIDGVREAHPEVPIVGFKAETGGDSEAQSASGSRKSSTSGEDEAMIEAARGTLDRAGLAFIVANDASVMGADETRALVVRSTSVREFVGTKDDLGATVAEELVHELSASA